MPDWRIEKSAISASKIGHKVMFGGRRPTAEYFTNYDKHRIFCKIYEVNWDYKAKVGISIFWHVVRKQVEKVIRESNPDIVHAHNIFAAKMISEFKIPFVYDDHEYWPVYIKTLSELPLDWHILQPKEAAMVLLKRKLIHSFTEWEKELVSNAPTIVTTNKVAEELEFSTGNTDRIFVIPNVPLKCEVEGFKNPIFHNTVSSVYVGKDKKTDASRPHRNMDGLTDVFTNNNIGNLTMIGVNGKSSENIKYLGILPRREMYEVMFKHSIGLIPYKKHWSHFYRDTNKAYEYAHAGLFVMSVSSLDNVVSNLDDNCATFEDYNDMASHLKHFREYSEELYSRRLKSFEFAHKNLVWEKYEKNILCAYQSC